MTIPSDLFRLNQAAKESVHPVENRRVIVVDDLLYYPDVLLQLAGCLDYGLTSVRGRVRYYSGEQAHISLWPRPIFEHILSRVNEHDGTGYTLDEFVKYPLTGGAP